MLIDNELKELLNKEIAVIMNDGQGYRGKLTKVDGDIIVLENIYETSNQEIEWVESKDTGDEGVKMKGYLPWRKITIPSVIIRIPLVLRIWPWVPDQLS
jgi:small nuclear ribonucleoprotein (snRNP)-like protein